jgi:hypothetical protein
MLALLVAHKRVTCRKLQVGIGLTFTKVIAAVFAKACSMAMAFERDGQAHRSVSEAQVLAPKALTIWSGPRFAITSHKPSLLIRTAAAV